MNRMVVFLLVGILSPLASLAEADPPAQLEASLLTNIRQVTFAGRRAGEGYFSQDGSQLIFQSERDTDNPFFQIYLMDLTTGDTQRVSPGYGKTTCAWIHPSRRKVLFASSHLDPQARDKQKQELELRATGKERRYAWDYDEYFDIFETDLQGQQLKNLTNTRGYDAEASWSPDGKLIVFSSNRHAYTEALSEEAAELFARDPGALLDLYVMNADGTNVRRLTDTLGTDGGAFFSPDGTRIVWRRFTPDGATAEIFTMQIDGSDQRQLTSLGAMSWAPYFHPSGDYVIFATNTHGFANFELYLVDSQGTAGRSALPTLTALTGCQCLRLMAIDWLGRVPVAAHNTPRFSLPIGTMLRHAYCWVLTTRAKTLARQQQRSMQVEQKSEQMIFSVILKPWPQKIWLVG